MYISYIGNSYKQYIYICLKEYVIRMNNDICVYINIYIHIRASATYFPAQIFSVKKPWQIVYKDLLAT